MRTRLLILGAGLTLACPRSARAADPVRYTISVQPAEAAPGESINLVLRCRATRPAKNALNFEHRSLTIELRCRGSAGEPRYAFPNRRVRSEGDLLMREVPPGGFCELRAAEERQRKFALTELFPVQLLAPGEYEISYSLASENRQIRSTVARFRIVSRRD